MEKKLIDTNVGLLNMEFSKNGCNLTFHFTNTYDGAYLYSLLFHNVYDFKYENDDLADEHDCQVSYMVLDMFEEKHIRSARFDKDLTRISLFSGFLEIELLCEKYEKIISTKFD